MKMLSKSYIESAFKKYNKDVKISRCSIEYINQLLESIVDLIEQYLDDNKDKTPFGLSNYIDANIFGDIKDDIKVELNKQNISNINAYIKKYMFIDMSNRMYNYIAVMIDAILDFIAKTITFDLSTTYRNIIEEKYIISILHNNDFLNMISF